MAVSESRKRANHKYDAKTYRVMSVKPRIKEVEDIRGYSKERGESLTRFVVRACYEQMKRDEEASRPRDYKMSAEEQQAWFEEFSFGRDEEPKERKERKFPF